MKRETREEAILSTLNRLDYLSRSQIQRLHNLGTDRNARRVLQEMSDYVSSFRDGENIYYLNASGRERIGSQRVRKKTIQARHYLMRNELYIALNCPLTWQNEMKIKGAGVILVCDAMYKNGNQYVFVEVDHMQKMTRNRTMIEKYRKIIEAQKTKPQLIWVTTTEHRRRRLTALCKGLNVKIIQLRN